MTKRRGLPKLPTRQLIILAICRFAEPVALTSVFPYLPEMIESFNVPKNEVAKWAGITSAVFSLAQCLTGIPWGRASDHFGRKPVVLVGLTCTMVTSILFGFSRTLVWAICARAVAGLGNGNVGIIRTTVAEMVPQRELQPRAFSIMPLVWTIGSIFGPAFGGALANPAERHPELFGKNAFFRKYPFALPNLVGSIFFLIGLSTGFLFLRETLATKKHRRDYGLALGKLLTSLCRKRKPKSPSWKTTHVESAAPLLGGSGNSSPTTPRGGTFSKPLPQKPPGYREVFSPQSNINLLVYTMLALHSVAFDQLLPIFMHHPSQDIHNNPDVRLPLKFSGGFGIAPSNFPLPAYMITHTSSSHPDSSRIGLLFTLYGIFGMTIQFLIFPPVARRFGVLNCLKVCSVTFPLVYIATPFSALLPTQTSQQWVMFAIMLVKCLAVIFAFPCSTILLTNSAVSLRILGTLNGVATSISAIGRAAGPAIGGGTFSAGVEAGYVIIPWWTLAILAALGAIPVFWLVEMEGFGGDGADSSISDEEEEEEEDEDEIEDSSDTDDMPTPTRPTGKFGSISSQAISFTDDDSGAISEEPDEFAVRSIGEPSMARVSSKTQPPPRPIRARDRRLSSPIGMRGGLGLGGERRFSNNLGPTRSGWGPGGTSYN